MRLLGVDETRARSVRWLLAETGWRRSDPWMTSFVDLDPTHPGGLLGLAPGRSGASVRGWFDLQSKVFRAGVEVVVVDPSAPFAAALRDVLPHATLVVDHWHLHRLANLMLTQVRQRVTHDICEPRAVPTRTVRAGLLDLTTAAGRMVARQTGAVARYESEQFRDCTRAGRTDAAGRGRWAGG